VRSVNIFSIIFEYLFLTERLVYGKSVSKLKKISFFRRT